MVYYYYYYYYYYYNYYYTMPFSLFSFTDPGLCTNNGVSLSAHMEEWKEKLTEFDKKKLVNEDCTINFKCFVNQSNSSL